MTTIRKRQTGTIIAQGNKPLRQLAEDSKGNLKDADLGGFDLEGACLKSANLCGADLYNANLRNADLRGADLRQANLYRADLRRTKLDSVNLGRAFLHWADLRRVVASEACLERADLTNADLRQANLARANLQHTKLVEVDLRYANLCEADLTNADLSLADLRYADLESANLWDVDLRDANLQDVFLLEVKLRFRFFPSIRTLSSLRLAQVSEETLRELMRLDCDAHPRPELFDEWAEGGLCPYRNEERWWCFPLKNMREVWRPGKPTMALRDLIIRICKEQGWKIKGYLE